MNLGNRLHYFLTANLAGRPMLRLQRKRQERRYADMDRTGDLYPPLMATARMAELLSHQYLKGRYVNGVRKVAWHSSGAPIEILQALGFFLYTPDNHAALCGARKMGTAFSEIAESRGYSRDICSYARTDFGSYFAQRTPVGRIPRPDLIVVSNNICQTVLHWYQAMGTYLNAPVFLVDTPFLYDEAEPHQIAYVKDQLEELIPVAETIAGRKLSYQRLQEVTRNGKRCSDLWLEILYRARHRPTPITGFDAFILMGPVVAMRGEPASITFYQQVLREIDQRIAQGIGAVKNEKHRILWDNLPIWYNLSWMSKKLASLGIAVAISNYTYQWAEPAMHMDPDRPIEGAARAYLHAILNRSSGYKLRHMRQMITDFDLDGVLLHSDRSCKPYSLGQIDQGAALLQEMGVPSLILEADHNDARIFSEEQVVNRIHAFAEMMG
ncbi:2-hydroxyacyl-CoA dehydratase family protein [bacterium]|nr:2-hydroxyacyl-CoA dehydratase family protein [bacterium]